MDFVFRISNLFVLPFWMLMIFLPAWRWSLRIMRSPLVSAAPAVLYAALVLPRIGAIWPVIFRPTLAGVTTLLSSPAAATIAWAHFLAFDLFVGSWIYLDSRERQLSPWVMAPVLFLTLMLGPVGFLCYLALRSQAVRTRPLQTMGAVMLVTFAATVIGIFVDPRVITGAPAWLKPAKFAISVSIYSFTLVWLLGFIRNRPRLVRTIVNLTTLSLAAEMIVILTQAARGTTSHFNVATPFDAALWYLMGAFITLLWIMNLLAVIALLRQRMTDEAFAWSLRLGLLIALAGMAEGFIMAALGAHSVGVPDGGPGIPILGWSTVGGDLRAAHFLGLHALQAMPLLGWLVSRRKDRLTLVWTAGLSYFGLVLLLTWQALRGQSIVHPDAQTLVALAALVAAAAAPNTVHFVRWGRPSVCGGL